MYRITVLLVLFMLLLTSQPFAKTSEGLDLTGVLKSRKVVGVIYFTKNNVKLSKTQKAEVDRIAALVASQSFSDKIVRVEGFATKHDHRSGPLTASFSRAKSVWHYLEQKNSFESRNLYLTGFTAKQSVSKLQGERVEIAIYDNPFKEEMNSYSSN